MTFSPGDRVCYRGAPGCVVVDRTRIQALIRFPNGDELWTVASNVTPDDPPEYVEVPRVRAVLASWQVFTVHHVHDDEVDLGPVYYRRPVTPPHVHEYVDKWVGSTNRLGLPIGECTVDQHCYSYGDHPIADTCIRWHQTGTLHRICECGAEEGS